jgi:hypothetical protein
MPKRLLALLAGFAVAAIPATAVAAPSQLHDCGTKVDRNVGNGWCHGTGTFRIVVSCADGTSVKSPYIRIYGGYGTLGVSCRKLATGVEIVEAP